MKNLLSIALILLFSGTPFAGIVSVDKTVHDWGDVTVSDGPLDCTFTVKNISGKPQTIKSVTKTCGCTKVSWTTGPIAPGATGTVKATYSNEDGPYPFDKTLNVFFEGVKKPLVLHIRGDVHKVKLPLSETYPLHYEGIGLKKNNIKIGNLLQGESAGTELTVANVTDGRIRLAWKNLSPFLTITPATTVIEAGQTASVHVSVEASRTLWGKNTYTATPVVNGKSAAEKVEFYAVTRENFASWSREQIDAAPVADSRMTLDPGSKVKGEKMEAAFEVSNSGKSPLLIYKVDFDSTQLKCTRSAGSIAPGSQAEFRFEVLTEAFEKDSDNYAVATLYTNDPSHPMVHLYIQIIIL